MDSLKQVVYHLPTLADKLLAKGFAAKSGKLGEQNRYGSVRYGRGDLTLELFHDSRRQVYYVAAKDLESSEGYSYGAIRTLLLIL